MVEKNNTKQSFLKRYQWPIITTLFLIIICSYFIIRRNCVVNVVFVPAKDGGEWGGGKIAEYYYVKDSPTYFMGGFDKFKTIGEAVSYCISSKFGSKK